jgi:AmmeMemoRadiSam system protein A
MTSDIDRVALLKIARDAITAHVSGLPQAPAPCQGALADPAGAFVTLHSQGHLRGCIGHVEADKPVAEVVAQCAVAACSTDPRFPAVTPSELPHVEIELSILGPLEPVTRLDEIEIGRHGLIVEMGWHRGLLLPQVATEWNWDREAFVQQTCHKAGLARDAWRKGATLWKFEAEVFAEGE